MTVALRKESVDRNYCGTSIGLSYDGSLSARRAWIEIYVVLRRCYHGRVALRKESVDRNFLFSVYSYVVLVALRKESVDRNACIGFH